METPSVSKTNYGFLIGRTVEQWIILYGHDINYKTDVSDENLFKTLSFYENCFNNVLFVIKY